MNYKKCIVLDLDNTLWGGVVGEDGMDGIKLSLDPAGASFVAFQRALLDLHDRGIILALNSRNNLKEALKVIRTHPNMVLKEKNFAAIRINWKDKSDNIRELAKELNIGTDSMVFIDDDPVNRALVRATLPEVEVPELPVDPSNYAKFLISLPYFALTAITDEDRMRGNLYVTERLRKEAEKNFRSRKKFLKDLGLEFHIFTDEPSTVARLAQMTEKTNQFNFNKQPMSEKKILNLIKNPKYKVFYGRLIDRFGDYGITNFAVAEDKGSLWNISHFLMSCRVIGRDVEKAFISSIARSAKVSKIKKISTTFIQTDKNKPAEEFVKKLFKKNIMPVHTFLKPPGWIKIKYGKIQ